MAAGGAIGTFIEEELASAGTIRLRRMFGAVGVFVDGLMFALIDDDVLYLKVDAASEPEFIAAGCASFTYAAASGKLTTMSYRRAPEAVFDDPELLRLWAGVAIAAARRAATKATKRLRSLTPGEGANRTPKTSRNLR